MKTIKIVKLDDSVYEIFSSFILDKTKLYFAKKLYSDNNEQHIILYFDEKNNMYKPYKNQPSYFKKEIKLAIVGSRTFNDLNIFINVFKY